MTNQQAIAQSSQNDISSKAYPVQTGWFMSKISSAILYALSLGIIIDLQFTHDISTDNIMFGVALVIFSFFFLVAYLLALKKNHSFQFLPEYIVINTGVIGKPEQHIPYSTIQDVNIVQSIPGRIFGFVNVTIKIATQGGIIKTNEVNIFGQTPTNAKIITEALKSILLTKNSLRAGL